jgi:hypothetical protein
MINSTRTFGAVALLALASCTDRAAMARTDSLQTELSSKEQLSAQLASQKDSLTRIVLDADAFIGQMDSAISTVKGLPRTKRAASDPLADQLQARKDMQTRVSALVTRAKQTAAQLAEVQKKEAEAQNATVELRDKNAAQAAKIEEDAQLIADLGTTIERQRNEITTLAAKIDTLGIEVTTLGRAHYRAYVTVGTESELLAKGVVVKEGGANLLVARPGRTLVPARVLNPEAFTEIDQRQTKVIQLPDTVSRYRIVSRQSLDAATVPWRDKTSFRGNLTIDKPSEFWGPSRFLILVKM